MQFVAEELGVQQGSSCADVQSKGTQSVPFINLTEEGAPSQARMASYNPLGAEAFNGDEVAPFFGFLGAAAALIFACKTLHNSGRDRSRLLI